MSVPGYESCRDSGVDWNPEVPSHWTDTRLRFVARLNPSKSEIASRDRQDHVSFVPMDAVGEDGSVRLDQTRPIGEVETGYTYFADGDVTLAKITPCFENGKGAVMRDLQGGIGFGTTELIVARPRAGNSADFLHWLFMSSAFRKLGEGAMYGAGGQKRVPDDFVRDFPVALPPHSEQTAIAAFLDRETGKIDALVEAQRRLIELLKEKRQAVISHAVTKGLDPAAPMKNSGVEWLGEVPAHWEALQLGRLCRQVSDGPHFSPSYVDDGVMFLSARNVRVDGWALEDAKFISEADYEDFCRRVIPEPGDILYTKGGTTGIARVVDLHTRFQVWVHIAVLKLWAGKADPHFVAYALNSTAGYEQSQLHTRGATNQDLGLTRMIKIWLALPPMDEQRAIVAHLEPLVGKVDLLSTEAASTISLLNERRAALISAAVTGKIDIRGLVPGQTARDAA